MTAVKLSAIANAISSASDNFIMYLDKQTGTVKEFIQTEDDLYSDEIADDDLESQELEKIQSEPERYLALPDQFEREDLRIMKDFAYTLENQEQSAALQTVLRNRSPYRNFKDLTNVFGLREKWFAFFNAACLEQARSFCEINDIPFEEN